MNLISKDLGRTTQQFQTDEVLPIGGLYVPDFVRLVSERYGFKPPPNMADGTQAGTTFQYGQHIAGNRKTYIRDIMIYSDAVSVATHDTESAEFVLDDFFSWGEHALGFRTPTTKMPRRFESNVVVEFEKDFERSFERFESLTRKLSNDAVATTKFAFGSDPLATSPQERAAFMIERRVNISYSSNRFFSAATLSTATHIEYLEEFEGLMA